VSCVLNKADTLSETQVKVLSTSVKNSNRNASGLVSLAVSGLLRCPVLTQLMRVYGALMWSLGTFADSFNLVAPHDLDE